MRSNDLLNPLERPLKCPSCAIRIAKKESQFPLSGLYALACLQCAAALVLSARPSRLQQEAMFVAISRAKNAPSRNAIIAEIKDVESNEQVDLFS
ncbi:hypothetical protein UFOVP14_54 [uncultured Caudovirales phage]|uniref:Uncharacterized protein n=1 Tax=uncultured Caudovirales phage TaxID=2100421 RepID=A0A6J5KND0_9CAUD|nr:hypothetical protein UFOVP14_54 [uncultured Caudovirales phage]